MVDLAQTGQHVILVAAAAQGQQRSGAETQALRRRVLPQIGARLHAGEKERVAVEEVDVGRDPRFPLIRALVGGPHAHAEADTAMQTRRHDLFRHRWRGDEHRQGHADDVGAGYSG